MSRLQLFCLVVAVYVSVSQRVTADQDLIGPIVAVQGQPIDLFFPNRVLPQPSVKVLQFVGEADNQGSTVALLGIHFDYTDAAGNTVIVPLPNFYQRAVPPGLHPIDAGPTTLPFCPNQVSIHFELLTPGEVRVSGIFITRVCRSRNQVLACCWGWEV